MSEHYGKLSHFSQSALCPAPDDDDDGGGGGGEPSLPLMIPFDSQPIFRLIIP